MELPRVVSPAEWRDARDKLWDKEKELTRLRDALAAERRRLPMVRFDTDYVFEGPEGNVGLLDLFDGRRQLIVYAFMIHPDGVVCDGCSMFVDNMGHRAHLNARDTTRVLVSRPPLAEILPYQRRMGWSEPWYSCRADSFYRDTNTGDGFGVNVFLRDGDDVYRTYFTKGRGVEELGTHWSYLDMTPLGRQENWEDSPAGYPQTQPYDWWRKHDEYDS
jgi:predicted dithiol-disulfide oxidoreductase (DUF899 family)